MPNYGLMYAIIDIGRVENLTNEALGIRKVNRRQLQDCMENVETWGVKR